MKKSIHQRVLKEYIDLKKNDPCVIAISIFGSVARGEERPDSDIDIEIVSTKEKKWQLSKKKYKGITIDLEICPKDKLFERIQKYPFLSYIFLKQKIVYDPEKFMKKLIQELQKYFEKHPEVVDFWERKYEVAKKAKNEGGLLSEPMDDYDEAEIRFSKQHKVTREFFRMRD